MVHVIQTENLTKHYRDVKAVDDVNLNIRQGEIYGFLGLNGAGKTTTIRMLMGMIHPDRGIVKLFGQTIGPAGPDLWNKVGHMVEMPYAYPELTVQENLEIFYRLRLLKERKLVNLVMEKLDIGKYRNTKAKNLSLGNAQRLGIAKALIHQPKLLILDEPANGLDPSGIVQIRELLLDLAENQGVSIFISSHILSEIARFTSRIGIIHEGKMISESDTHMLDKSRLRALHICTLDNKSAMEMLTRQGFEPKQLHDGSIEISQEGAISNPEKISALLVSNKLPPTKLLVWEEDLEHFFLRIIESKPKLV